MKSKLCTALSLVAALVLACSVGFAETAETTETVRTYTCVGCGEEFPADEGSVLLCGDHVACPACTEVLAKSRAIAEAAEADAEATETEATVTELTAEEEAIMGALYDHVNLRNCRQHYFCQEESANHRRCKHCGGRLCNGLKHGFERCYGWTAPVNHSAPSSAPPTGGAAMPET